MTMAMKAIVRGSEDDRAAWQWARAEQGYTGTWEEWLAMPIDERREYEAGAAGGDTPRAVA